MKNKDNRSKEKNVYKPPKIHIISIKNKQTIKTTILIESMLCCTWHQQDFVFLGGFLLGGNNFFSPHIYAETFHG